MHHKSNTVGVIQCILVALPFIFIAWIAIGLLRYQVEGEFSQFIIWLPTLMLALLANFRFFYFVFGVRNFELGKLAIQNDKKTTLHPIWIALLIVVSLVASYFIYIIYLIFVGIFIWMYFIGDHPWPIYLEIAFFSAAAVMAAFPFWLCMSLGIKLINRMNHR